LAGEVYAGLTSSLLARNEDLQSAFTAGFDVPRKGLSFWSSAKNQHGLAAYGSGEGYSSIKYLDLNYGVGFARGNLRGAIVGGRTAATPLIGDQTSKMEVETQYFGGNVAYRQNRLSAHIGLGLGQHRIGARRSVEFPGLAEASSARIEARSAQLFGEVSYALADGPIRLAPYASFSAIRFATDRFSEAGGIAALTVLEQERTVQQGFVGLRAAAGFALSSSLRLSPRLDAAWQHSRGDLIGRSSAMFAGSSDPFSVDSAAIPADALRLNGGIDVDWGQLKLGVGYKETVGGYWSDRSGSVTLGLRF
jgi:outer membrane autotransporter protein